LSNHSFRSLWREVEFVVRSVSGRTRNLKFAAAWLVVAGLTGCSSGDESSGDGGSACVPGSSVSCAGPSGCQGFQLCDADGERYEICECGNGSSGSSVGGSSGGAQVTGTKSSPSLGGRISGGGSSTSGSQGTLPSGGVAGSAASPSCSPRSMVGFKPSTYVPARPRQAVCSDAQIAAYLEDCLHDGACGRFSNEGSDAACGKCLAPSPADATSYGPLIEAAPAPFYVRETNFAGCIELLGQRACAEKVQAAAECAEAACEEGCVVSSAEYGSCVTAARSGTCTAYVQQATCIPEPSLANLCSGTTFDSSALSIARVFCGIEGQP
jgi:hypothetical protein